jgi:hypothetical protein
MDAYEADVTGILISNVSELFLHISVHVVVQRSLRM